jgi:hypothetical protein
MPKARVGRRLAAIVAADVAGYSRLMGLDEVGTARTLREHRAVTDALVAKHGGRIVKTTGDGDDYSGSKLGRRLFRSKLSWCLSSPTFECVAERADLGVSQ